MFKNLLTKQKMASLFMLFVISVIANSVFAADYYWRAVTVGNLYTNVNNWELGSSGSGVFPAVAPSISDDVYFTVPSNYTSINFNNGNCKRLTVSVAAPAMFTFFGQMTAFSGSLNSNGQATFIATINFMGAGSHTLKIGTALNQVDGRWNFNGSIGTYTLDGPLNTKADMRFSNGQSFSTNGNDFSFNNLSIAGANTKTINFSNSLITANAYNFLDRTIDIAAPNITTTYDFTNTRIVMNNTYTGSTQISNSVSLAAGIQISLQSLTFNAFAGSNNVGVINLNGNSGGSLTKITLDSLVLNTGNLFVGDFKDYASRATGSLVVGDLVLGKAEGNSIIVNDSLTLSVANISELGGCARNYIHANGRLLRLTTTTPITTTHTSYYGVVFDGSGLTASSSGNIAFNSGAVTWGAALSGSTFWWVGGTGNWNDPTKWSISGSGGTAQTASGCLPSLKDDVYFDGNSFSDTATVTIPAGYNARCQNLDWSAGSNQGLLTSPNTGNPENNVIKGNQLIIQGSSNFSKARGIGVDLTYVGSGTHTIKSGSFFTYTNTYVRLMGTGTYTLSDNFIGTGNTTYFQHRTGNFNTGGKTLDVGKFISISLPSIVENLRQLNIANSTINIRAGAHNVGAGYVNNIDVSYLTSLDATNSTINLSAPTGPYFGVTKGDPHAVPYLATVNLNNVNFLSPSPGYFRAYFQGAVGGYTLNYNNVSFSNSAELTSDRRIIHNVNNYKLSAGYIYSFENHSTFNVLNEIQTTTNSCNDLVIINSFTPGGTRANINKADLPFNVNNVFISDINASAAQMTVIAGVDNGNNNNVIIATPAIGKTKFWVGNAGNWTDGSHWSIGVSGGNPTLTNPFGCIPSVIDSVVFDNNSFSLDNQVVTLDADGNCHGMMWTSGAGVRKPVLAGATTYLLNNYGSMELGAGMSSSFTGTMYMRGSDTGINTNYIDMNGVISNADMRLVGGGRYDVVDTISLLGPVNNYKYFTLQRGNLIMHGNDLTVAGAVQLNVINGNSANISNSHISALFYYAFHNATAGSTWDATGSNITVTNQMDIRNYIPVTYGNVLVRSYYSGASIKGDAVNQLTFNKIKFTNLSWFSLLDGVFSIDTLEYVPSSKNLLVPGGVKKYTINNDLIVYGTPCTPAFIRSSVQGTPAILNRTICNTNLNFVNLRDITFGTCTAAENEVIGADEGGNSNVTITSIPGLTNLGPDITFVCDGSATGSAVGFGTIPGIEYLWSTGATTRDITINTPGKYWAFVTFAPGCTVSDTILVSLTTKAPIVMPSGKVQLSPGDCSDGTYIGYYGAASSSTGDHSILAIAPNGNTLSEGDATVTVNNQGTLIDAAGPGDFSNPGTGYYQNTDNASSTVRISRRLHSVVASGGPYSLNGGLRVRVYYDAADLTNMINDAWPNSESIAFQGWFKHPEHDAQLVVNNLEPGKLPLASAVTPVATGVDRGVSYVEFLVSDLGTFGYLASTKANALPLDLLAFDVQKLADNNAMISWKTAREDNVSHFELMHSTDGKEWKSISGQAAKRGVHSTNDYSYTHKDLESGKHMYRLKMVDNDGTFKFSEVKVVIIGKENGNIQIYPNPASHVLNIKLQRGSEKAQFELVDASGRTIKTGNLNGNSTTRIDVRNFAQGVYLLKMTVDGHTSVQKVQIIR